MAANKPGPLCVTTADPIDEGTSCLFRSPIPGPTCIMNNNYPAKMDSIIRFRKPWKVSDKLLSFLGIWENGVANGKNYMGQMVTDGFILTVYNDSRNLPTVGCGHLVVAKDELKVGDIITKDKANDLLKHDLTTAENAINENVTVSLSEYEYDALVSIAFNAGAHGVVKLASLVNAGKYDVIPDQIKNYRTGGGNEHRRSSEAKLFKSGIYDSNH